MKYFVSYFKDISPHRYPKEIKYWLCQITLTIGGRTTVWLVSSLTVLDYTKQENMLLFETTESKPVKLGPAVQ